MKNYKAFNIFLPSIIVTAAWCVPLLGLIFHMQIQSRGQNFICEVRTASSTNLLAALKEKMKHMPWLSCFSSSVVWKAAIFIFFFPNRSYPENHFQLASLKLQHPCANHILGNICFTLKRGLQRKPALLTIFFLTEYQISFILLAKCTFIIIAGRAWCVGGFRE